MTTIENRASPPLARATRRPAADFHEYVIDYSRGQRWNVFLIFAGVTLATGAAIYFHGAALWLSIIVGVGIAAAGGGGLLIAAEAHAAYTRHFSTVTTETYADPTPAAATVRPFIPSTNAPHTTRAGKFALPPATWAALWAAAAANDGRLTRDDAARVLPRPMYRDWQTTIGELHRLGMVDSDGRVTAGGWRDVLPLPHGDEAHAGAPGTHARRTPTAHGVAS